MSESHHRLRWNPGFFRRVWSLQFGTSQCAWYYSAAALLTESRTDMEFYGAGSEGARTSGGAGVDHGGGRHRAVAAVPHARQRACQRCRPAAQLVAGLPGLWRAPHTPVPHLPSPGAACLALVPLDCFILERVQCLLVLWSQTMRRASPILASVMVMEYKKLCNSSAAEALRTL